MTRATLLHRAAAAALAAMSVLLAGPLQGQAAPAPPGRLVSVDGYRMHIHCRGSGSPIVVLDAGAGAWSLAWLHIQESLAPLTRTCVFDRAGLGWSEPRPEPRTSERAARELRGLLKAAGEGPPFVMVGHSYGGYNARLFRHLFGAEVAGMALLDSAHEDQWERLPAVVKTLLDASLDAVRSTAAAATEGRFTADSVAPHAYFARSPSLDAAYRAEMSDADHHRTYLRELEDLETSTAQVRVTGGLGSLPLAVLSSAREFDPYRRTPIPVEEANRIWLELQDELASLSSDVVHLVSRTGPHTIQYAEPEVVAGLLRELLARVRRAGEQPGRDPPGGGGRPR